jgi:hypothetical protein
MAYGTVNADVITTSTAGGILGAGNASIMKNRIINGAMVIDQRNAGASVTITGAQYVLDRWRSSAAQSSKFSIQQNAGSVTPPIGFSNYLGCTSLSSYTVGASEGFGIFQRIEGFNFSDLNWGTANAKTITLSMWVYSSLTGTFGGVLKNSAQDRIYPFTYTISSANTWTQASVTIAGDTSGTWVGSTNGIGVQVQFSIGAGSSASGTAGSWTTTNYDSATGAVSVVGTNGATFYITGCQLEVGSSNTGFEYVNYQTSLANCQRYYFRNTPGGNYSNLCSLGMATGTTSIEMTGAFPVQMRSTPAVSTSNARLIDGVTGITINSITIAWAGSYGTGITFNVTGATQYRPYYLQNNNNTTGYIDFSSEL